MNEELLRRWTEEQDEGVSECVSEWALLCFELDCRKTLIEFFASSWSSQWRSWRRWRPHGGGCEFIPRQLQPRAISPSNSSALSQAEVDSGRSVTPLASFKSPMTGACGCSSQLFWFPWLRQFTELRFLDRLWLILRSISVIVLVDDYGVLWRATIRVLGVDQLIDFVVDGVMLIEVL